MKEVLTTVYKSFDGKIFKTKEECENYEASRKEIEENIEYFMVHYEPDLTETGYFQRIMFVAVYSNYFLHFDVITNYCIKKFRYLGPSVQGYGFQRYFRINKIKKEEFFEKQVSPFNKAVVAERFLILSPKKFEDFFPKDSIYFDYMKEWGFE